MIQSIEKRDKRKLVCLKCRKKGHILKNCKSYGKHTAVACFRCGSSDHTLKSCTNSIDTASLPFATCFVCKNQGHIASSCPKNENGIYPNGGGCRFCGSKFHLVKNCPDRYSRNTNIDLLDQEDSLPSKPKQLSKVVHF